MHKNRYFMWFFNRDYNSQLEVMSSNGLEIKDVEKFSNFVRKGTKINFVMLHLFLIFVVYALIKSLM